MDIAFQVSVIPGTAIENTGTSSEVMNVSSKFSLEVFNARASHRLQIQ
jgi:hypothetical protein